MIDRESWLDLTKDLLHELSSKEYQERIWLRGEGPDVSSWEDSTCDFELVVDDGGFLDEHWEEFGLSKLQYLKLTKLRSMLDKYNPPGGNPPDPKKIQEDRKWHQVREFAAQVNELFHELFND